MSEIISDAPINVAPAAMEQRKKVVGRPFPPGISGNPAGRARGSRNRPSDSFISDLRDCWERHGVAALERVAVEQPEVLVKVIAGILPRDLNLSVNVDASEFAVKFRSAIEALGNEP
jgi:hypothetical protein